MPDLDQSDLLNTCPECGEVLDVSRYGPYEKTQCPQCEAPMRVRTRFDHFLIKRELGKGGMSRVFVAEDTLLGRDVALKILHPEFTANADLTSQFEREARLTASISHPNVVKVYSVGRDQEYFYIAMELVDGKSLEEIIRDQSGLDESEALDIAVQVAQGLRAAHQTGLIHRDIKPGNILLTKDNVAKIVDFGLALVAGKDIDRSGIIWATPYYVPPEKLHDEPEDFRSDIYSLGASFFHVLAGRPPFSADTSSLEELKAMKTKSVSLKGAAPGIADTTCRVIDRMLERKPGDRHPDYEELLADLNSARAVLREGVTEEAMRPYSQRTLLMVAILFFCFAGYLWYNGVREREKREEDAAPTLDGSQSLLNGETVSGKEITGRFIEARELLLAGETVEAEAAFRQVAKAPYVTQPTLNWALFNLGVSQLIQGNIPNSRLSFTSIAEKGLYSEEPDEKEVAEFFLESSGHLRRDLPVMEEAVVDSGGGDVGAMAWLAYGLKNWQHGRYAEAKMFFDRFRGAEPRMQLDWINRYKVLLESYEHDMELIDRVPKPRNTMSFEEAKAVVVAYGVLRKEIRTRGSFSRLARDRAGRAQELLERRESEIRGEERERLAEARKQAEETRAREFAELSALVASLEEYGPRRAFAEALEKLSDAKFTDAEVVQATGDEVRAWEKARRFREVLIEDLNAHGYRGEIMRSGATTMTGEVHRAGDESIDVRLEFGETTLPLDSISHEGLRLMVKQLLANPALEAVRNERLENYIFFSRQAGRPELALEEAELLAADDEEFRARWGRLNGGREKSAEEAEERGE